MKIFRTYLRKLENKSSNSISHEQMKIFSQHLIENKLGDIQKPLVVIFCNPNVYNNIKSNSFYKYYKQTFEKRGCLIVSDIVDSKFMESENVKGFYLFKIHQNGHGLGINPMTLKVKNQRNIITKIISGGQTGADIGGLIAGRFLKLYTGGVAPKSYLTENGANFELKTLYGLREHESANYNKRTITNILESDGTIVFGNLSSIGSKLTIDTCLKNNKPLFRVEGLRKDIDSYKERFKTWVIAYNIKTLNVAGNRESVSKGIQKYTVKFLIRNISRSGLVKYAGNIFVDRFNCNYDEYKVWMKEETVKRFKDARAKNIIEKLGIAEQMGAN
jgi:hypothetical protein